MSIKTKEDKKDDLYTGMSLRHERVENRKMPKINIFCEEPNLQKAIQVSYGIEEEGIPYDIFLDENPYEEALTDIKRAGIGVAISVEAGKTGVFTRQYKEQAPLLSYEAEDEESLRIAGKNSARIIKHKPFILTEED